MARNVTYLPEKEMYTKDELLTAKLPRKWSRESKIEHMVVTFYSIMFEKLGKSYEWAKAHDMKELPIIFLLYLSKEELDDLSEIMKQILKFQFPSMSKKQIEDGVGLFILWYAVTYYDSEEGLEKAKESVRYRIKEYEDKYGMLSYADGWQNDIKEWCNYR